MGTYGLRLRALAIEEETASKPVTRWRALAPTAVRLFKVFRAVTTVRAPRLRPFR
jgi:hypothetical protein